MEQIGFVTLNLSSPSSRKKCQYLPLGDSRIIWLLSQEVRDRLYFFMFHHLPLESTGMWIFGHKHMSSYLHKLVIQSDRQVSPGGVIGTKNLHSPGKCPNQIGLATNFLVLFYLNLEFFPANIQSSHAGMWHFGLKSYSSKKYNSHFPVKIHKYIFPEYLF